ncbi:GNAT family N-acetyltransferase [Mariniplasma anaerobium]|uniref:N-acetyltransferase n=1 Tax=Mariniplasma anaerobium TaxID=2735436 RepID=A0A7U9TIJ7_9MOLU|nr:N-acetyltransferase [Mariniplasma anaerobium]BCR36510.1 N-acetyltransferase [Mariniplasma anaerobium]
MINKENIEIRPYKIADYSQVVDILILSFESKFKKLTNLETNNLKSYMMDALLFDNQPQDGYFVATIKNEVVGVVKATYSNKAKVNNTNKTSFFYLEKKYGLRNVIKLRFAMILLSDSTNKGEYYIEHIAVSERARGHGIGTKLLEKVFDEANRLDEIDKVTLYVAGTNQGAVKLYERIGFKTIKKRKSFLMQLVFKKRTWFFMSKYLNGESRPKLTLNRYWWLGLLGLIGFVYINDIRNVFIHGENYFILLNLLWFSWFIYFIPSKR